MNPMMNNPNFYNINQNLMNPNLIIPNINPNFAQLNPNMIPNMNQINQNMIANMNINMNQINQNMIPNLNDMNLNMGQLNLNRDQNNNNNEEIEDVLPYIDEPKMVLKFSNITSAKNGTYVKVKLPKSITKSDLYSIAKKYQVDYYSNILLSCNNYLLKNDDTSIEGIEEGSVINIIEDVDFPDGAYYKALMEKNKNYETKSIFFKVEGKMNKIQFPKNITVSEMVRAAFSKLLINYKSASIDSIDKSDETKIINKFYDNKAFTIYFSDPLEPHWKFGKIIYARVFNKAKKENTITTTISIGTLNSINQLISSVEGFFTKKVKKIIIGKKELYKNEIKNFSLKSIGINDNFTFLVEFENQVGFDI